jgi:RsiW-degrading membrane proteinase PrsW (M82 family)
MGYLIFALTTSIASILILMRPVYQRLKKNEPLNMLVQAPAITYFVFAILGILAAPFILLPTLIPSQSELFKDTLYESIKG